MGPHPSPNPEKWRPRRVGPGRLLRTTENPFAKGPHSHCLNSAKKSSTPLGSRRVRLCTTSRTWASPLVSRLRPLCANLDRDENATFHRVHQTIRAYAKKTLWFISFSQRREKPQRHLLLCASGSVRSWPPQVTFQLTRKRNNASAKQTTNNPKSDTNR